MEIELSPRSTGQIRSIVSGIFVLAAGILSCLGALGGGKSVGLLLGLGLCLLGGGAVGLASGYWLAPAQLVTRWKRNLAFGRWLAAGVVITCAIGASFEPFFAAMLVLASLLFASAALRYDRMYRQSVRGGLSLFVTGLLGTALALALIGF